MGADPDPLPEKYSQEMLPRPLSPKPCGFQLSLDLTVLLKLSVSLSNTI